MTQTRESDEYRSDELARLAGVASTTVRLYRTKGLLPAPRMQGRTGWFNDAHLARLRLIARLQGEGYSLAGIRNLLEQWEQGRSLDSVIGIEAQLAELFGDGSAVELSLAELIERFPTDSLDATNVQRAASLGLIQPASGGRVRVVDRRFLDTGAALAHLGIPPDVILDEWEVLLAAAGQTAERFMVLFDTYLIGDENSAALTAENAADLSPKLAELHGIARQVVLAALDASIARLGRQRLAQSAACP